MKSVLLSLVLGAGMSLTPALFGADDAAKPMDKTVISVLICNHCGARMTSKDDPEAAAAKHPKACSLKDACAASGFCVISGKDQVKLDAGSADKAKAHLGKEDNPPKVAVKGTINTDGTLKVDTIEPVK